jgi:hypothetical protein
MIEIIETLILGVGIAAGWFYLRTLLSGDLSNRSVSRWALIVVPQGVFIAWAIRVLGII